jgi:hypothetical protein
MSGNFNRLGFDGGQIQVRQTELDLIKYTIEWASKMD